MKILVTGSRLKDDDRRDAWIEIVCDTLDNYLINDLFLTFGDASGIDAFAEGWCAFNNISYSRYKADWNKHGKAAGVLRNMDMYDEVQPDLVLAFWDGISKGTKQMIDYALKFKSEVRVIHLV